MMLKGKTAKMAYGIWIHDKSTQRGYLTIDIQFMNLCLCAALDSEDIVIAIV